MMKRTDSACRVGVAMPVYNGENFVEEAIESILSQSFQDLELVISDNASTDRTGKIAARSPPATNGSATTETPKTSGPLRTTAVCSP